MNRSVIVSNDKGPLRRRWNDQSQVSKMNADNAGGSGASKRFDKSRLLCPSVNHREDCLQPQLSNVKERSPVTVEMAAATVQATVSERSPVTEPVEVNGMICDPKMVADNVDVIDARNSQKELSSVSLRKPAGITRSSD